MPEPTKPAVAPSQVPTTPAPTTPAPTTPAPTTPAPTTPAPTTPKPAEPGTPVSAPVGEPVVASPVAPQVPPVQPTPVIPPTGEPTTPPDPAAAPPPEGGPRVVPKADGYKLPDGMPTEIGQFAHSNDMTQEQLDASLTQFGAFVSHNKKVEQLNLRSAGDEFVKTWGENSKYNLSLAKRALNQNDPEGVLTKALNESGYGNHPAMINFLYTIGKSMREGGFLKSAVNRPQGKQTAAQKMFPDHPSEND